MEVLPQLSTWLRACCDHVLGEVILGVVVRYITVMFWSQKFAGVANRV